MTQINGFGANAQEFEYPKLVANIRLKLVLQQFEIKPATKMVNFKVVKKGALEMAAYSIDLRQKILSAWQNFEGTQKKLAKPTAYALTVTKGAETIVGFNEAEPKKILSNAAVTGLQPGESLLGIDFRPANGLLYGVGSSNRLYTIDPVTGAATAVGNGQFAVPLTAGAAGFDFNPTVDRIRFVNQAGQNARLNPDTGAIVDSDTLTGGIQLDGNLAYAEGDRNFGNSPAGVGAAYVNNFAGATSTTLFVIDTNSDYLVRQAPPNNGVLNTIGPLGIDAGTVLGFDIRSVDGNETALAAIEVGGVSGLYNINLTTGQASIVGKIGDGRGIKGLALTLI
jgi:Domain of unknown function (DUF4394)